jgi:Mg-chelatase subunit ChlD
VELVVDRSGSMSGAPLTWAKRAASAAVDQLSDTDCAGVIVFDSVATPTVPLAPTAGADRSRTTRRLLDAVEAGGGTELLAALDLAHAELRRAPGSRRRHVLLLTDGQAPSGGLAGRVGAMSRDGITVSTVGLGSGVDADLLRTLARAGGGRFEAVSDPSALVDVFKREIEAVRAN